MRWLVTLLTAVFFATVQSQTWIGAYIPNSSCSTGSCCCLVSSINVTRPSNNTLAFSTMLAGVYCGGLTFYATNITYPSGYTFSVTISIITLNIVLSSDSNNINVSNSLGAACGVAARRSNVILTSTVQSTTTQTHSGTGNSLWQYDNMFMLFNMVFVGMMMVD